MSLEEILLSGAPSLNIRLDGEIIARLRTYYEMLDGKNRVMNLTAITGEDNTARLHFLDSLALLGLCDFSGARVIDVGTGAGFPGLPIAIAEPSAEVTLLDSLGKRVDFLKEVCEKTHTDCTCLHARAEEAAREGALRESFDIGVSRAVARLNVLCELCLPFVKPDGVFIAMKAADSDEEISEAKGAIKKLGGGAPVIREYTIPGTDVVRRAVAVPKVSPTPEAYPRRFAKIQKSPL